MKFCPLEIFFAKKVALRARKGAGVPKGTFSFLGPLGAVGASNLPKYKVPSVNAHSVQSILWFIHQKSHCPVFLLSGRMQVSVKSHLRFGSRWISPQVFVRVRLYPTYEYACTHLHL